jgi:hypothetical protein
MYKVSNLDATRTMEDQIALLASTAKVVLDAWWGQNQAAQAASDALQAPMQRLHQQLTETDVFMSGWMARNST